jgi:hypothetical protein
MSSKNLLLGALRRAARFVFQRELRLRREGARLRLVWTDTPSPAGDPAAVPAPPGDSRLTREQAQLQAMRDELRELLDELPGTREECASLCFFESALERGGLRALEDVPLDVLVSALQQFEGLVTNWGPEGLARLRSKMAVAAAARRKALAASLAAENASPSAHASRPG